MSILQLLAIYTHNGRHMTMKSARPWAKFIFNVYLHVMSFSSYTFSRSKKISLLLKADHSSSSVRSLRVGSIQWTFRAPTCSCVYSLPVCPIIGRLADWLFSSEKGRGRWTSLRNAGLTLVCISAPLCSYSPWRIFRSGDNYWNVCVISTVWTGRE